MIRFKRLIIHFFILRRKEILKFDLNIGFDNTRFGVTFNAGYDTKGSNVRGGLGFGAIY